MRQTGLKRDFEAMKDLTCDGTALMGGPMLPRVSLCAMLVPLVTERAANHHLVRGEHGANAAPESASD